MTADTATVENLACIHCGERPRMGVGFGKMAESCATCIPEKIAEGYCPICMTEGYGNPDHMAKCRGKKPAAKKPKKPKLGDDGRSLEQIHRDAVASGSMEARREATAALKAMTPEQRLAYKEALKAEGQAAKASKIAVTKDDPEGLIPTDRCPACNTFLDDKGRCADEGCERTGQKPAMWED